MEIATIFFQIYSVYGFGAVSRWQFHNLFYPNQQKSLTFWIFLFEFGSYLFHLFPEITIFSSYLRCLSSITHPSLENGRLLNEAQLPNASNLSTSNLSTLSPIEVAKVWKKGTKISRWKKVGFQVCQVCLGGAKFPSKNCPSGWKSTFWQISEKPWTEKLPTFFMLQKLIFFRKNRDANSPVVLLGGWHPRTC